MRTSDKSPLILQHLSASESCPSQCNQLRSFRPTLPYAASVSQLSPAIGHSLAAPALQRAAVVLSTFHCLYHFPIPLSSLAMRQQFFQLGKQKANP